MAASPRVGLFVTCLIDFARPSVAEAAVHLLEAAGCQIDVPRAQSCCGQPALNSGDNATTRTLARQVIDAFEDLDYLVAPSGSCLATIKIDYPALFADDDAWRARAEALAAKSYELLQFLSEVQTLPADYRVSLAERATYHDSCSGLRSLGIKSAARTLLARVDGLELVEMGNAEVCCGFGGTFCVKYPEISTRLNDDKIAGIVESGADLVIGGDLGCLMTIAGRLSRLGKPQRCLHVAEVLAGMGDSAIGEA